jgi:hypothetical protein
VQRLLQLSCRRRGDNISVLDLLLEEDDASVRFGLRTFETLEVIQELEDVLLLLLLDT